MGQSGRRQGWLGGVNPGAPALGRATGPEEPAASPAKAPAGLSGGEAGTVAAVQATTGFPAARYREALTRMMFHDHELVLDPGTAGG
jgi:hypothetical protein